MTGFKDRLPATDRVVTLRDPDGNAVVELNALSAAAAGALVLLKAPRLVAIGAVAALMRGMSITIDGPAEPTTEA